MLHVGDTETATAANMHLDIESFNQRHDADLKITHGLRGFALSPGIQTLTRSREGRDGGAAYINSITGDDMRRS